MDVMPKGPHQVRGSILGLHPKLYIRIDLIYTFYERKLITSLRSKTTRKLTSASSIVLDGY